MLSKFTNKRMRMLPVFGEELSEGVDFYEGEAAGVPRAGTASGADYSPYAHSILDPFRGPVVPMPSLTAPPMIPRCVRSNKNLNGKFNDYLYVVNWYSPDQSVECFVRSVSDGKFYRYPQEDLLPSLKLSDNYTQMAVQGGGIAIKSSTYVGGVLPPSGVVTVATLLDAPEYRDLTPEQVIAYAQNTLFGIAQVPIVEGVVAIAPPSFLSSQIIVPDNGNICPQGNNWKATDTFTAGSPIPTGSGWKTPPPAGNVDIYDTNGTEVIPPNLRGKVRLSLNANIQLTAESSCIVRMVVTSHTVDNDGLTQPLESVFTTYVSGGGTDAGGSLTWEFDTLYVIERVRVNVEGTVGAVAMSVFPGMTNQFVLESFDMYNNGSQMPVSIISISGITQDQQIAMETSMRFQTVPNAELQKNTSTRGEYLSDITELMALQDIFSNPEAKGISFCYTGTQFSELQSNGTFTNASRFSTMGSAAGKFGTRLKQFFIKAAPAIGAGIGAIFGKPLEGMRTTQAMMAHMPGGYQGNASGFIGTASGRGLKRPYNRGKHVPYTFEAFIPNRDPELKDEDLDKIKVSSEARKGSASGKVEKGKMKEKGPRPAVKKVITPEQRNRLLAAAAELADKSRQGQRAQIRGSQPSDPLQFGAISEPTVQDLDLSEEDEEGGETDEMERDSDEEEEEDLDQPGPSVRLAAKPSQPDITQRQKVTKGTNNNPVPAAKNPAQEMPRGHFQVNRLLWVVDGAAGIRSTQSGIGWKKCLSNTTKAVFKDDKSKSVVLPHVKFSLGYFPVVALDKSVFWGVIIVSDAPMDGSDGQPLDYEDLTGTPYRVQVGVHKDTRDQARIMYAAAHNRGNKAEMDLLHSRRFLTMLGGAIKEGQWSFMVPVVDGPSAGLALRMAYYNCPARCWFTGAYNGDNTPGEIDDVPYKIAGATVMGQVIMVQGSISEGNATKLAAKGYGTPLTFMDVVVGTESVGNYLIVNSFTQAYAYAKMIMVETVGASADEKLKNREKADKALEAAKLKGASTNQTVIIGRDPNDTRKIITVNVDIYGLTNNGVIDPDKVHRWLDTLPKPPAPKVEQDLLMAVYRTRAHQLGVKIYPGSYPLDWDDSQGTWRLIPDLGNYDISKLKSFVPVVGAMDTIASLYRTLTNVKPKKAGKVPAFKNIRTNTVLEDLAL